MLDIDDVPINSNRAVEAGTGYPDGEAFTLQLIEILEGASRQAVERVCYVGCRATFSSTNTHIAKPSGLLLHYNYGTAAVKWWGHQISHSQGPAPTPPTLPPPPPPRPSRRPPRPRPAPGPSTAGPSSNLRPRLAARDGSTANQKRAQRSKTRSGKKKEVQDSSAVDVADEPAKEWETWDEDDWMFYFMFNTKAARERRQAAEEASSSNIRAWAEEVSQGI